MTFGSPFLQNSEIPFDYRMPGCYLIPKPIQKKSTHIKKFAEETLIYIFYNIPRDKIQLEAAQELYWVR